MGVQRKSPHTSSQTERAGVLASVALCIANDYVRNRPFFLDSTPSRIGSSAWFFSYVIWGLPPTSRRSLGVKLRWFRPPLPTRVLLLSPCFCLWPFFRMCEARSFFFWFFSPLSLNLSTDMISLHRVWLNKNKAASDWSGG